MLGGAGFGDAGVEEVEVGHMYLHYRAATRSK
jgi:hypothetical protein